MFVVVPLLMAGIVMFAVVKGLSEWASNNAQPVLTERATMVTKRTRVWGGSGDSSASTSYYATFELPSGERREVRVSGTEYGLLAEGDQGELTVQGTRYKGFVRTR